jgi:TolA-binding protein
MNPSSIAGPDVDFRKAVSFEKEKKYPEAIAAYRKIVRDYPQSPVAADALFAIAHLHAFYDNPQKDYSQALVDFEDFDKRYPNHEKVE